MEGVSLRLGTALLLEDMDPSGSLGLEETDHGLDLDQIVAEPDHVQCLDLLPGQFLDRRA
jgi:hypothetical protein